MSPGRLHKRGSGILLHITSLPSSYGIGDMGPGAYRFVDFLSETNQSFWQILPLNRTSLVYGNSPYSSYSAFAGNPLLISPDLLVDNGVLLQSDIAPCPSFSRGKVNYGAVTSFKKRILNIAYEKNKESLAKDHEFRKFCNKHSDWLDDYSLFAALKNHFRGDDWSKWPEDVRDRKEDALKEWGTRLQDIILMEKFFQYLFFKQWYLLKNYCDSKHILIIGDMPIYVNYDSSDVWANTGLFSLNEIKRPLFVAGVPPDYFSSTGQLWGHPVYNWEALKETGYSWWIKRFEHNVRLFHLFRLDHFRGFVAYWKIRAGDETAVNGEWVDVPAESFFSTISKHFLYFPVIAEDLGIITQDVGEIMNKYGFPGMKVLLFAFGENLSTNPYAPHNHIKNCVVYTGTHDNNTVRGWFKNEMDVEGRKKVSSYIGRRVTEKNIHWEFIRLALSSVADMAIVPMQDVLGLGEKARMNQPATTLGNWKWRLAEKQLSPFLRQKLLEMTLIYGRG